MYNISKSYAKLCDCKLKNSQLTPAISLWDCARIVNMLVLLRLLRIIPNFRPMALVTSVLLDIIKSLKSFAGIIIIIYYVFAVVGMWCFRNAIRPPTNANGTIGLFFVVAKKIH